MFNNSRRPLSRHPSASQHLLSSGSSAQPTGMATDPSCTFAESLCIDVAQQVLAVYGKQLTKEAQRAALGRRPLDCWCDVAKLLGLEGVVTGQQLFDQSEPLLTAK